MEDTITVTDKKHQIVISSELIDRFFSHVIICDINKCWLWNGSVSGAGYGHIKLRTDDDVFDYSVHRLSFIIHNGFIIEDLQVMHSCDVKICINPLHLSQGGQSANTTDAHSSGLISSSLVEFCPKGHPYNEENTVYRPPSTGHHGGRQCRRCNHLYSQQRRANFGGRHGRR